MAAGLMLAIVAGALVGVQNIFNNRVSREAGQRATTALVLGLGFAASLALGFALEGASLFDLSGMRVWYAFSGLIGVGVVLSMLQGIRRLGPTYGVAVAMTSQLGFAMLWDSLGWFGLDKVPFRWQELAGVLIIVGGIAVFKLGGDKVSLTRARNAQASDASHAASASSRTSV